MQPNFLSILEFSSNAKHFVQNKVLSALYKIPEGVLNRFGLSRHPARPNERIHAFVNEMGAWLESVSYRIPIHIHPTRKAEAYRWQDSQFLNRGSESVMEGGAWVTSGSLKWHPALTTTRDKAIYFENKVEELGTRLHSLQARYACLADIKSTLLAAPQHPFLDKPFPKVASSQAAFLNPQFKVRTSLFFSLDNTI
jgi:hypothetical protein